MSDNVKIQEERLRILKAIAKMQTVDTAAIAKEMLHIKELCPEAEWPRGDN